MLELKIIALCPSLAQGHLPGKTLPLFSKG
jgi:hypothetical protein